MGGRGHNVRTISYTFDEASQLHTVTDPDADYEFLYDELGRATSVGIELTGLTPVVKFKQEYDAMGNRVELEAKIGETYDFVNTYTYNSHNNMTRVVQTNREGGHTVADKLVGFGYDAKDRLSAVGRYAATFLSDIVGDNQVAVSQYAYDRMDRLVGLVHRKVLSDTFADYAWTYDAASRVTSFTNAQHTAENATYDYDDRDQLIGAQRTGTENDESYDYDDNGNRETANGETYSTGTACPPAISPRHSCHAGPQAEGGCSVRPPITAI